MYTVEKNRVKYDYNYLKSYCDDNNIELLKDYINEKVTRDTIIEAKCKTDDCDGFVKKKFRDFINIGCFCRNCIIQNWKEKIKKTNLQRFGVENAFQSQDIKDKIKEINLKKYGVVNPMQSQEFRDKVKKTNIERYGVENVLQSQEFRDKVKKTNLERFGVENAFQSQDIKDKIKETNIEKYGFESAMQSKEVKDKIKKTCLQKYGVEHTSQAPEIAEKQSKSSYKRKLYKFPSGKTEYIQGYENTALDELLNSGVQEQDIIIGCKNVPEIWYEDETTKKHRHFVDIFIKSQNKCIEVKSTWTAAKKKDCIFLKQKAAKQLGYEYEIWVYNNKREKVEFHK